jgi:predicted nucleic acid-binding protein
MLQPHHSLYSIADRAIERLLEHGQELHIVPQNLIELWVVATRPAYGNGLGMPPSRAAAAPTRLKDMFILLPDSEAIYPVWESLVITYQVVGKPTHDARLVAAMQVHGLSAVLTFDKSGFTRFPGIEVFHPADLTGKAFF